MEFREYKEFVKSLPYGKRLPDAVYLHESALSSVPIELSKLLATTIVDLGLDDHAWNIIKFFVRDFKITLLHYPSFFEEAYPCLSTSHTIDLQNKCYRSSDFSKSDNPPILHRKETFLLPNHLQVEGFTEITQEGVDAGLYENSRSIGFKNNWERIIRKKGYVLIDGRLKRLETLSAENSRIPTNHHIDVDRHLTAIDRNKLSLP